MNESKRASRADLIKERPDVLCQKQMRTRPLNTKSAYHSLTKCLFIQTGKIV